MDGRLVAVTHPGSGRRSLSSKPLTIMVSIVPSRMVPLMLGNAVGWFHIAHELIERIESAAPKKAATIPPPTA